jgi:hypothetical protein
MKKQVTQYKINIVTLKSAEVIDYEPYSSDDGSIYSHKYTIIGKDIKIKEEPSEIHTTTFTNN